MLLISSASYVTWLDHHRSAIPDYCGQDFFEKGNTRFEAISSTTHIVLDNEHSGAWLAWAHYHPDLPMPKLIEHIEDRDLWKFQLRYTKEIIEGLRQNPQTFEAWDQYLQDDNNLTDLERVGSVLVNAVNERTRKVAEGSPRPVSLKDSEGILHQFIAANVINDISEAGHALNTKFNLPSLTFFIKDLQVICSLRTQDDFDVSRIARHYGGGGHQKAAGFKISVKKFFTEIWV